MAQSRQSMRDSAHKLLYDIQLACDDIEAFIAGMDLDGFRSDLKSQRAVGREFEIIGEALNRVRRDIPDLIMKISSHHEINGFRNVLAHGYDIVSEDIVWQAAIQHMAKLKKEVIQLLDS